MLHNNMLKHISGFLLAIAVVPFSLALSSCGCGTSSRQSGAGTQGSEEKAYYPKAAGSFRIMSYNVGNFSKYLPFNDNIDMIASMIKESEADVVALNEIDSLTQRLPYDEISLLTKALGGWQWHFGRAMPYQGGAYGEGCIVPGKVKIIKRYTVALPQDEGAEPRAIAVIETDKYVIGASHLDHVSPVARLAQAKVVNAWAQENYFKCKKPVFYCGDMNASPESEVIETLRKSWDLLSETENTFSSRDPRVCIDYIFHYKMSAPVKKVSAHTMTEFHKGDVTQASDHLPVFVDVRL